MATKLFHYDGPLGQFMLRVWELLLLNILCILFCIPIITAGASLTAVAYVTLRMAEGRENSVLRSFLRSFKENLLQAAGLELILAAAGGLLYLDARYIQGRLVGSGPSAEVTVLAAILLMAVLFYLMAILYVFAVQARFHGTVCSALRNSVLMSVRHLPVTLFLLLADVLFYVIAVRYLTWLLLWCYSGPAAFNAIFLSRCFKKYQSENKPISS